MNTYEKTLLIYDYEKLRTSFTKAIDAAGGNGEALWTTLDSFTAKELMIHIATNNIVFTYEPPNT